MIVDNTNVLLLTVAGEDGASQGARCTSGCALRAKGERLTVTAATVFEVVYVLESTRAGYGWEREAIACAIEAILDEPAFAVEHEAALRHAAPTHSGGSIDLHDCFLSAIANSGQTRVLSFDGDLHRLGTGERP